MGLSEISHFGTFQRVGGKAGGFISKKFFHPSNFKNQEKLWKAQTESERDRRKQLEMEKRRDEERQVEELRKQMYLAGQGKAGDFMSTNSLEPAEKLVGGQANEQRLAFEEQKRRRAAVKQEQMERNKRLSEAAVKAEGGEQGSDSDEDEDCADSDLRSHKDSKQPEMAKSRYKEDVFVLGHASIWGSWFSQDEKRWGFNCCKSLAKIEPCPLVAKEAKPEAAKDEPRGKKRRRGKETADAEVQGGTEAASSSNPASRKSDGQGSQARVDPASLIDPKFIQAAEKRRREKQLREEQEQAEAKAKAEAATYMTNLLEEPS